MVYPIRNALVAMNNLPRPKSNPMVVINQLKVISSSTPITHHWSTPPTNASSPSRQQPTAKTPNRNRSIFVHHLRHRSFDRFKVRVQLRHPSASLNRRRMCQNRPWKKYRRHQQVRRGKYSAVVSREHRPDAQHLDEGIPRPKPKKGLSRMSFDTPPDIASILWLKRKHDWSVSSLFLRLPRRNTFVIVRCHLDYDTDEETDKLLGLEHRIHAKNQAVRDAVCREIFRRETFEQGISLSRLCPNRRVNPNLKKVKLDLILWRWKFTFSFFSNSFPKTNWTFLLL